MCHGHEETGESEGLTSISKSATALTANTTTHDGSCGELLPLSWRHHKCSGSCLQAARCADQCARWHLQPGERPGIVTSDRQPKTPVVHSDAQDKEDRAPAKQACASRGCPHMAGTQAHRLEQYVTRRHAEHFFSRPFHSPVSEPHSAHMCTCLWRAMAGAGCKRCSGTGTWRRINRTGSTSMAMLRE
jgi:hypothetical protein